VVLPAQRHRGRCRADRVRGRRDHLHPGQAAGDLEHPAQVVPGERDASRRRGGESFGPEGHPADAVQLVPAKRQVDAIEPDVLVARRREDGHAL
jgi:hypothetical protein